MLLIGVSCWGNLAILTWPKGQGGALAPLEPMAHFSNLLCMHVGLTC